MIIAIELNNIVRDYNTQVLKYYRKGYDPSFDDETVDLKCSDLLQVMPFASKADRKTFKEIDYPYELFGCARTTSKHLHVNMCDWLDSNEDIEVIYFSIGESDLMIQSTYFFLSKGSRVKTMKFLNNGGEIWNYCDVAVTINEDVVNSKPDDKTVIVINKSDNKQLQEKADVTFDSLTEIINTKNFSMKIETQKFINPSFIDNLKTNINKTKIKFLSWMGKK